MGTAGMKKRVQGDPRGPGGPPHSRCLVRALLLLTVAATLAAEPGNIYTLPDGEIEWISEAAFRYLRRWGAPADSKPPITREPVDVRVSETPAQSRFRTRHLTVTIEKPSLKLRVATASGRVLTADAAEPRRFADVITIERITSPDERFYGLGIRRDAALDARGLTITTDRPLLISSAGWGEYRAPRARYTYAIGDKVRTEHSGDRVESFFYYGPSIKEILEQHVLVTGPMTYFRATDTEVLAPGNVPRFATPLGYQGTAIDIIRAVIHGSLSGVMASSLDLTPYSKDPLYRRIVQLGMLMPVVQATRPIPTELVAARHQLGPYLETYLQEARDRGIPVIRPLAMQYSSDPEAARYTDAFMLGDEILAAPMYTTGETRSVYLPMGTWTDLDTNQAWPGRQVIPVSAKHNRVPLFAKNGTILPLAAGGSESPIGEGPGKSAALILHYFPKLAAEFFLFESHSGETTQFHAAPAGIYLRLEVESKEDRIYDWVVHHIPEPSEIAGDGLSFRRVQARLEEPATWFYDSPARNLYVRMRGPAGGDNIVNISFPETRGITRQ